MYNTGKTTYQYGVYMHWEPVAKPAEVVEKRLLEAIIDGTLPIGSNLPGERDLAAQLGVTRPTLREALQRLARDGWLDIQQGKSTRVRHYWQEGSLAILAGLAQHATHSPPDFVANLLEIRTLLVPASVRQAIQNAPVAINAFLEEAATLDDTAKAYTRFDWRLQHKCTQLATNPIFRLLLNSFEEIYNLMGEIYFSSEVCRQHSRAYYHALQECIDDPEGAEALTCRIMRESQDLWHDLQGGNP
jgi:GntR family negative regulator for fad regulon and positive regulator of fabA